MNELETTDATAAGLSQRLALRRAERRNFFRLAGGAAAGMAALGSGEMIAPAAAEAQAASAPSDSDVLNFALNLEYLESPSTARASPQA